MDELKRPAGRKVQVQLCEDRPQTTCFAFLSLFQALANKLKRHPLWHLGVKDAVISLCACLRQDLYLLESLWPHLSTAGITSCDGDAGDCGG